MPNKNLYQNVSVEKNDRSEAVITAEIPAEAAAAYRAGALKHLGRDLELPGFRKGHVPEHMIAERLGVPKIWEEIAEMAIADAYPAIVVEHELRAIGRPSITVTKLAPDNPIVFRAEVALEPTITLPDYRAVAKTVSAEPGDATVTDADVENVITGLRTNKWRIDNKEKAERGVEPKPEELPEMTDELVRSLGDFSNLDDFMAKLRENLKLEKERKAKEARRVKIGDAIVAETSIALPRVLVEGELNGMLAQFRADVERMGMKFDEYLSKTGKTESDLRREWQNDAERRAKLQLVLNEIAKQENIQPSEEGIAREIERVKQHVKDADDTRLRLYVTTVLTNEMVFSFLEKQAETLLSQS